MSLLRSSSTYHERRLKNKIRDGESPLRWVDYYAAEHAYEAMSVYQRAQGDANDSNGNSKANDLVRDLILLLSYLSSLGHHKLSLDKLEHYSVYFMSQHKATPGQIRNMLIQHSFVFSGNEQSSATEETSSEQLDLWSTQAPPSDIVSSVLPFLALENDDVYLYRYWAMQNQIIQWRNERLMRPIALSESEVSSLSPLIHELFKLDATREEIDYQALAAAQALVANLSLVSGGPGTGKTSTAAKIMVLHLLLAQLRGDAQTSIHLPKVICLAPTGKASQRLASEVREQAERLIQSLSLGAKDKSAIQSALPDEGYTIHRYLLSLGEQLDPLMRAKSKSFTARLASKSNQQGEGEPCLVVVDESSMVDLSLMRKLVGVTSDKTALVFLGDYFQLAPVEPGDVFGDWVREFAQQRVPDQQLACLSALLQQDVSQGFAGQAEACAVRTNPLTILRKSYRFTGVLAECAELVKAGSLSKFENFAGQQTEQNVARVLRLDPPNSENAYLLTVAPEHLAAMRSAYEGFKVCVLEKAGLEALHEAFSKVQILCSTYQGPYGADSINAHIDADIRGSVLAQTNYHGRPILLTRNYAQYGLYNGDIGFLIEQADGQSFQLMFYREGAEAISILPARISNHELAYAISIHKSQGSEYDEVHVLLAPYAKELLTRSLLYTGITRAKKQVSVYLDAPSMLRIWT